MFKNIGDVVAQHVPAFVALPWAGVAFLLDVRDSLRVHGLFDVFMIYYS
jgi:hypothetical protein